MTRLLLTAATAAVVAAALGGAAPTAATIAIVGTVGPGPTIKLEDGTDYPAAVARLDAGTYALTVHDLSDRHNFHLIGPGIDQAVTSVPFVGDTTVTVTLSEGTYVFQCDPHATTMRGTFAVSTPPPPPPARKPIAARVGPGASLAFPARLAAGDYAVTVRDLSSVDNLHLRGPGVNRRTGVAFRGTVKWNVSLAAGTYRAWSDKHPKLTRTIRVS